MSNDAILNENLLLLHARMERIGKALEFLWGEKEFPPYVNGLLSDTRGNRKGFPGDVLIAIMNLQELHDVMFPQFRLVEPDNWLSSQFGVL